MYRFREIKFLNKFKIQIRNLSQADVVIIGGGSQGCHTFYHLTKNGVKTVLLERSKLTSGTTWHTAGCVWSFRPYDIDTQLLTSSRNLLMSLENQYGLNTGWIQNGGLFIAHSKTRLDEYKRLASLGKSFGIQNYILTPNETVKIFPKLDKNSFIGSLYSPGDGVVDPAMLCNALTKAGIKNGGEIIEDCPVHEILSENKKVTGVLTSNGIIKTDIVVNATGVWGRDLVEKYNIKLPLIPMKHAYVVSERIPGIQGMPNIRDHDYSIYFRIQGESICMGGYENNPIIMDKIPLDFIFTLYDLDWSVFDTHIKGAVKLCPDFNKYGIKTTVCGPESFTPDHKPLIGPDPKLRGLFHNCGYNAVGMMFAGGCAEQLASWIINGSPDLDMYQFDVRRFTSEQICYQNWIKERSHESYVKNYNIVFPNDQRLSARNLKIDALHDELISQGAVMEEKQGWERPAFFINDRKIIIPKYDWYGSYNNQKNLDESYKDILKGDLRYKFSEHHDLIGKEALFCRNNAVVFNMSYFGKMYLDGVEANKVINWISSANLESGNNRSS